MMRPACIIACRGWGPHPARRCARSSRPRHTIGLACPAVHLPNAVSAWREDARPPSHARCAPPGGISLVPRHKSAARGDLHPAWPRLARGGLRMAPPMNRAGACLSSRLRIPRKQREKREKREKRGKRGTPSFRSPPAMRARAPPADGAPALPDGARTPEGWPGGPAPRTQSLVGMALWTRPPAWYPRCLSRRRAGTHTHTTPRCQSSRCARRARRARALRRPASRRSHAPP
jgi:hypothetical protein